MESLKGKTALITGAGKGIGREVALGLAKEGVKLGLLSTSPVQLLDIENELKTLGYSISIVTADITDIHSVILAVDKIEEELGAIDIFINNMDATIAGPFYEFDPVTSENNLKMNRLGFYYLTQAVMPSMMLKSTGDIITISSKGKLMDSDAVYNSYPLPESILEEAMRHNIRYKSFTAEDVKSFNFSATEDLVDNTLQFHLAEYVITQLKQFGGLNLQDSVLTSSNPI
ncbi:SDR family NAD(P)-dependent oxidoreductase [Anditalea andensis]|uniref:Short-chain dehydrogenase n=1 Tax=Anditalea andensis TaxID=1048983 RepID=A0A074LJV0_9BACT|nr:SDR family NAD(P)-dependent oxidoreductase [Anditalea andensis]KEO74077.1 hypothetical protein EL17_08000 [Anditalea andensis]